MWYLQMNFMNDNQIYTLFRTRAKQIGYVKSLKFNYTKTSKGKNNITCALHPYFTFSIPRISKAWICYLKFEGMERKWKQKFCVWRVTWNVPISNWMFNVHTRDALENKVRKRTRVHSRYIHVSPSSHPSWSLLCMSSIRLIVSFCCWVL